MNILNATKLFEMVSFIGCEFDLYKKKPYVNESVGAKYPEHLVLSYQALFKIELINTLILFQN